MGGNKVRYQEIGRQIGALGCQKVAEGVTKAQKKSGTVGSVEEY